MRKPAALHLPTPQPGRDRSMLLSVLWHVACRRFSPRGFRPACPRQSSAPCKGSKHAAPQAGPGGNPKQARPPTPVPDSAQQPAGAARQPREQAPRLQAFDGSPGTKWLDFGGSNGGTTWLAYALPQAQGPAVLAGYSLTSGNDAPVRDPRDWTLEGRPATGTGGTASPGLQIGGVGCLRPMAESGGVPAPAECLCEPGFLLGRTAWATEWLFQPA